MTIANWLRETRLRQIESGSRKPWTQEHLLGLMKTEVGWAPHRPNYSKYERGKAMPEPETLDKFVAFWTARNEPGPDFTPPVAPDPEPTLAAALMALAGELEASRSERETGEARLRYLEGAVAILAHAAGVKLPAPPVPDGTKG